MAVPEQAPDNYAENKQIIDAALGVPAVVATGAGATALAAVRFDALSAVLPHGEAQQMATTTLADWSNHADILFAGGVAAVGLGAAYGLVWGGATAINRWATYRRSDARFLKKANVSW